MRVLLDILLTLQLLSLLASSTPEIQPRPRPEYFAEYLNLDRRAAVEYIRSFAGNIDMFPLIPPIIRAREYTLFDLIQPSLWIRFLDTTDSKYILGPDIFKQMIQAVCHVRHGEIRPEVLSALLRTSLVAEDGIDNPKIVYFFKDAAATPLWDCLGIFGQIGLYQTCSLLNNTYKKQIRSTYTSEHPSKGFRLSFRTIFKHWKLAPEGSKRKEDLQLFLGLHHNFKHYAKFIFGQSLDDFSHFPWDPSIADSIKSNYLTRSPVLHMVIFGIDPDVIRVIIKAYPEYMRYEWSLHCAHTIVLGLKNMVAMSFIKTALKQGRVQLSTLADYSRMSETNPELICLLVDLVVKPVIWDPLALSLFLVCMWKKSQIEDILDALPTKSFEVSLPAMKHLLAVGVDFTKISRPFTSVGVSLFSSVEESMVVNLLRRGLVDEDFVLVVLDNISSFWKPAQIHVQLAFDLGYSHRVIYWLSKPKV